ncbi:MULTISPECIES: PP2C family protein-serine/threonine phosphatase [unclassified Streptomyces]|uniref:PP2C family protein-serine/threonine phosphatase n=1 Tax=unclassified Streptomyces TaxID=2593676 RepID=UPI000B824BF4|nr:MULTISPECIES: GAF domain-containing SpoIIE family protein phosphatase [unclassified Streptomyces]MYS20307.1 SpoIIE family protein phosphatase [Streptomyces sp. SID4948]
MPPNDDLLRIADQLKELGRTQEKLHTLLAAMLSVSRDLDLSRVLRRIVTSAMGLVGARYGAMGVLAEDGDGLSVFIPEGLSDEEVADLAGVGLPRGRGLLGYLIQHPQPLRVDEIRAHPASAGFPPGHPPMDTLLGVAITVQGRVYGNLYLSERRDGRPFDAQDEEVVVALAGAAAVAIENARLYEQVRADSEKFQRLLLPRLSDLGPFRAAAVYRPAAEPDQLGGDWYDALTLPDGSCCMAIGDVCGHDLTAAAAMSQTRSMLRALLYTRLRQPSRMLTQLDLALNAMPSSLVTTALLARIDRRGEQWSLEWSNAGHPPPLLLAPGQAPRYLDDDPCLPLGVDLNLPRYDSNCRLPDGSTVVLFTDGLIEHRHRPIQTGLRSLAELVAAHASLPPGELCELLADEHPGDGRDDIAVMTVRVPDAP